MNKCAATVLMLFAALFLLPGCVFCERSENCAAGTLKIGWGKRSIAMEGPVPISGQFHLRVSQGTHTPVETSALVIENSKDAVIFVSCDVVSVRPPVLMQVREMLKKELPEVPVEKIIINATHTHAGPSTNNIIVDYPNKVKIVPSAEVQKFIARRIADAVKEAWQSRRAGSVAYGYGFATTGHSRRAIYLRDMGKTIKASSGVAVNGNCIMYGSTSNPDFASYEAGTDTFINLLYTFDAKGKLTGAVINVPCPSQTSESVWAYNASFWHNVREKLAAKYGKNIGVIAQSAAAGDLAPRQLHYQNAEKRRYMLKYRELIEEYVKNPMPRPAFNGVVDKNVPVDSGEVVELMRAEDIANRIVAAFDEVLSWAGKEKFHAPVLRHQIKTLQLPKKDFPKALVLEEQRKHAASMKERFKTAGDPVSMLIHNSRLASRRRRMAAIATRYEQVKKEPFLLTDVHVVRIGNIAFATNRFELFLDYQHRIQGRSPFEQTFIVQLTVDPQGSGSYLATERGERNKGYSATPYSNQVSYKGGQVLVNETVRMLFALIDRKIVTKKNPAVIYVPKVKGTPAAADWKKAPQLKDLCVIRKNLLQRSPTTVRLLHDGKFLYVKAVCSVTAKGEKLMAPPTAMTGRDGSLWQYDSVEFFIGRKKDSYQFIFAPGNKLADFSHSAADKVAGMAWNSKKVRVSTSFTETGWEGVLAIPLDELAFPGKTKAGEYNFNFGRNALVQSASGRTDRETGAYLPLTGSFKDIEGCGTLKLTR